MWSLPVLLLAATAFAGPRSLPGDKAPKPVPVMVFELEEEPEIEWMQPLRRCRRATRYYCDGPRRVPVAHGSEAELAEKLEIGSRRFFDHLLTGRPTEHVRAHIDEEPDETLLWPVPEGYMGRGFGFVRRAAIRHRPHRGVDIPAPEGAIVRSTNPGIVVYADNGVEGYGNLVIVLHKDNTRTHYAHLSEARVFAGQQVARGETLGLVGSTGLAYAAHLHFEWRRGTVARNPARRFAERPSRSEARAMMIAQQNRREELAAQVADWRARVSRRGT